MGRIVDESLFKMIHDFFTVYLSNQRSCSLHTVRSYQKSLEGFLDFVKEQNQIELSSITFEMLNSTTLSSYLDSIEENGCSIATRNNRLNGIRAFFSYVAKIDVTKLIYKIDISKIPLKKQAETEVVEYMSETAIKALLEQPNPLTKKGLRDSFIMLLMYDTGARIGGIIDISICDMKVGKTPVVTLHEKGSKVHSVPIMKQTVDHFKNYMNVYHPDENLYSKAPLFYTDRKNTKAKIDNSTIRKFIKNYSDVARKECPEIPPNVHPHMLRHSRAMHLYQHDMDLTLISQWLGHSRLETTLIYAHADTEQKRKAIEAATPTDSLFSSKRNSERFTVTDDETLKKLYGLK